MEEKKYIKYPKIPHLESFPEILDKEVKVFEKLDGGNAQIRKIDYRVLCGSRANFIPKANYFRFAWFKKFLHWTMSNKSLYNMPEDKIIFGEWLAPHTLEYRLTNYNNFYLIDVFDLNINKFLDYEKSKELIEEYKLEDIQILPTLLEGKVSFKNVKKLVKKSDYRDGFAEGVVVKDYKNQKFAKLWTMKTKEDKDLFFEYLEKAVYSVLNAGKSITKKEVEKELETSFNQRNLSYDKNKLHDFVKENYFLFEK